MAGSFGAAGFAVVARGNAVAVGRAESSYFQRVFDRGLKCVDASLELVLLGVAERCGRGSGALLRGRRGRGLGQGVKGRLDFRVLVRRRDCELFERGVTVCRSRRKVVKVAVELGHQVVGCM